MFVRVTLNARPYIFKLDTGAARTVIAANVARALALPFRGGASSATTFGCTTKVVISVRATIHGQSAGRYVVDTGSPTAAIEARTSLRLGLRAVGRNVTIRGATGCSTSATPVRVTDWNAGGVKLPTIVAVSSPSAFIDRRDQRQGIVGLIGANALAPFGRVTFDFEHGRMVLGDTAPEQHP